VEHILKCTPVIQTTAHLRHEFVGNIDSKAAVLDSPVKNVAKVLFAFKASFAVLSNTLGAAKVQRPQSSWPEVSNLFLKPIRNIRGKFFFGWHAVYVTQMHIYSQANTFNFFLYNNL
jgi:hypothetical protein